MGWAKDELVIVIHLMFSDCNSNYIGKSLITNCLILIWNQETSLG